MMVKKSVIHREELSFRLLRTALFLLPPVTAFYLMQFLYGAWPWQTAPGAALANVICVGALYFLMCGLTGRPAVCCVLLHILCGLWGTANYFVALYRGSPVLPWDLTALGTAAAVSGSYSYRPTWQMAVGLALIAGLIWLLRGCAWAGRSGRENGRVGPGGGLPHRRGPGGLSEEHGVHAGGGAGGHEPPAPGADPEPGGPRGAGCGGGGAPQYCGYYERILGRF